jgi:glutathione peroxidase-family protein
MNTRAPVFTGQTLVEMLAGICNEEFYRYFCYTNTSNVYSLFTRGLLGYKIEEKRTRILRRISGTGIAIFKQANMPDELKWNFLHFLSKKNPKSIALYSVPARSNIPAPLV